MKSIVISFFMLTTLMGCADTKYVYRAQYHPIPSNLINKVDVPKPISRSTYLSYSCTKRESEDSILIGKLYDTIAVLQTDRKSLREWDVSGAAAAEK